LKNSGDPWAFAILRVWNKVKRKIEKATPKDFKVWLFALLQADVLLSCHRKLRGFSGKDRRKEKTRIGGFLCLFIS